MGTKIEIWARGPKLDPLLPDNEAPYEFFDLGRRAGFD